MEGSHEIQFMFPTLFTSARGLASLPALASSSWPGWQASILQGGPSLSWEHSVSFTFPSKYCQPRSSHRLVWNTQQVFSPRSSSCENCPTTSIIFWLCTVCCFIVSYDSCTFCFRKVWIRNRSTFSFSSLCRREKGQIPVNYSQFSFPHTAQFTSHTKSSLVRGVKTER